MTALTVSRTIPVLRMFDVAKAEDFYERFLGFSVDWDHRFDAGYPLYRQISRDGVILHLTEHYRDASPGASVLFQVAGIEALHLELAKKDDRYTKPALDPWIGGGLCLIVSDPFANRLTFYQPDEDGNGG